MSHQYPLPLHPNDSLARRRHNLKLNTNKDTSNSHQRQEGATTTISITGESQPNFPNFPSVSQIWDTAQKSIQTLADSYYSTNSADQQILIASANIDSAEMPPLPIEMPCYDRTTEFRTIAKSYRNNNPSQSKQSPSERERMIRTSAQFNQQAKRVGRDLGMTFAKLEKLMQLAKKKSLFDDSYGEVEELSKIITQDISGLKKQIDLLQKTLQSTGIQDRQCENHSKLVVVGLQSRLASMSKSFQSALELRTESLKAKKDRREKFGKSVLQSALSHHPAAINDGQAKSSSVALDMGEVQQLQEQSLFYEDNYHQSRFNAIESIESSITELGVVFRQLASLVSEQGEMITRIDSNVEDVSMNIDSAHHELIKYFNNISKNRWLIIKVFGVLMAFFVFFVIFLT